MDVVAIAKKPSRFVVYRQRSSCDASTIAAMESEVRNLRQEVSRTQDSLRAATRRCRELVRELDGLSAEHERERLLRDQQLSRILRALLVLEARLKQEQKSIRQLLCEKDNVIRNQQLEIARLRRYTKSIIKGKREQQQQQEQQQQGCETDKDSTDLPSLESSDYQDHDSGLSKDIQKLKCEIITKLNESLDQDSVTSGINIRKTHSFAGSDISKTSLTSSENTDASIITTTTDGSPSLLSTEGFCEGESTDVSPGSTLNKSSSRCTPTIVTTDSETEVTMVILDEKTIARSESKDDGMDCNYASDEDEDDDELDDEPIYENNARNLQQASEDCSNNNNNANVEVRITRIDDQSDDMLQNQDESSGNWYSDPDEDRINDEMLRHSVYRPNPGNHNSVLECVNQILLRDMEDEENILSVPRRFKHRGKIVRFQPARLSDIESVGSEMERRNSDEPPAKTPVTITTTVDVHDREDANDNELEVPIDGFEATNSEDEFGMRIVPVLDPESGLEEDVEETKARPIVIIEPCVKDEPLNNSIITRSSTRNKNTTSSSSKSLNNEDRLAKNLDYEEIEDSSLPEIIAPTATKVPPALPPKPQFRVNNTLVLKKIPSPSFLIDETSQKKQAQTEVLALGSKNPLPPASMRSLKFEDIPKKRNDETTSYWKNRFNNVRSSFQLRQGDPSRVSPEPRKVTNIVKHFEEFKIEGSNDEAPTKKPPPPPTEFEVDEYDIQQNFEEFNLDECDLSDDPDRPEADGSEMFANAVVTSLVSPNDNSSTSKNLENNNTVGSNGNYDSFLEATGLSNKSILTPSRLLSNHKSMLKPKDVKYKSKIKATAVLERHGISSSASTTHTRHWTGPFV